MSKWKELTAPCGIDCFNCELYADNITEEIKQKFSVYWKIPAEKVACRGCRAQDGCRLHYSECETLDCVKQKGVAFCFECAEFPCVRLQPASDQAARLPHNMKVYNLCRMKAVGVDAWAEKESAEIRKRYFKNKMIVGKGPVGE